MTYNCPFIKFGKQFNMRREIKALFLKVFCGSQFLDKVVKIIPHVRTGYLLATETFPAIIINIGFCWLNPWDSKKSN